MLSAVPGVGAAQKAGLAFSHLDWEITCDNTRTCRAAGYHSDPSDDNGNFPLPVSVLLTRTAGPGTTVQAQLQMRDEEGEEMDADRLRQLSLAMKINGNAVGNVLVNKDTWTLELTPHQTGLLIPALAGAGRIEWSDGKHTWRLSNQGAGAVFLKMDEFQGRLGTSGAVLRKGTRDESTVLPALPTPLVAAAAVPAASAVRLPKARLAALRTAVRASMKDCTDEESVRRRDELVVHRLSSSTLLASTACWTGAYNQGLAYWVVNASPPYVPRLVTSDGTDYDAGTITASHKGRGVGDCWSSRQWTWDGKRFVPTSETTTGQCKSFMGGAWSLPVLVTAVRRPGG